MSELKPVLRFAFDSESMYETEHGKYVLHSDHAETVQQLQRELEDTHEAFKSARGMLDDTRAELASAREQLQHLCCCENPAPNSGVAHVSMCCPIHNQNPNECPLQEQLQAANARADAAEEDAARLDFLDQLNAALNSHYGADYGWRLTLSPNIVRLWSGRHTNGFVGDIDLNDSEGGNKKYGSCRNVIDAARAKQQDGDDAKD